MKTRLLFVSLLALAGVCLVQAQASNSGPANVNVSIENEAKELARGYARAFSALRRPPYTLTMQKGEKLFVIEDIRELRAMEGVLIAEVGKGISYLINAKDVVAITDGPAIKQSP
jgi:hypothetical protein